MTQIILLQLLPHELEALRRLPECLERLSQLKDQERPLTACQAARHVRVRTGVLLQALRSGTLVGHFHEGYGGKGRWSIKLRNLMIWDATRKRGKKGAPGAWLRPHVLDG